VRALETHREIITGAMTKLGTDTQDARDRVIRMEEKMGALNEKVSALPTKAWIGTVVVSAMGFFGAVIAAVAAIVHFFVK
jgi:hypothetical protein